MTPIEIYKMLPKTNCRKCPQGTCMAFAVALSKGEASVDDCPELDSGVKETLSNIEVIDWKAQLIERLREEIKCIDLFSIARGIGAEIDNDGIIVHLFGMPYKVYPDGRIETVGYINPWIEILLLHYVRTSGKGEPSEKWVSFSELKSGMVKAASFQRDCEEPLKELLDRDLKGVESLLMRMGARKEEVEGCPFAWYLRALPKIPVLILYWPSSNEEPSQVRILFDRTADRFLDVESLIFVFEGLVNLIEKGGFRQ